MAELKDGERVEVEGSTNWYTIARDGDVYSCTCPAWRHQRLPVEMRSCKHIQAYLGDEERVSYQPLENVPADPDETEDARKKREAIVDECVEKYVVFYDRFEELTGLRLPEHVAIFAGFYLALTPEEKTWLTGQDKKNGLRGVARWFEEGFGGDDAAVLTRDRHPTDPIEFFPLYESVDGRYGLFYDEPAELPSSIAFFGISTEKETSFLLEPTLLRSLYEQRRYRGAVRVEYGLVSADNSESPADAKLRASIFNWLGACAKREAKTARSRIIRKEGWPINGGVAPYIRGWVLPKDLQNWQSTHDRMTAYQQGQTAKVEEIVDLAKQDLADGSPGRALVIGRELHWHGAPEYLTIASELLIRAYVALGRRPLADITQAHYRKYYPETNVFELPRSHAIVLAAANGDLDAIRSSDAGDVAPSEADVAEAIANAISVDTVNALFDLEVTTHSDNALVRRLSELERMKGGKLKGGESFADVRDVVRVLLSRGEVTARAFGKLLGIKEEEELSKLAASRVDLESHDARGATALHFAAGAARPDLVKALLERGADATAEDSRGRKAFEAARGAWRNHPREAGEIFALLEAAGGGEKKKTEPPPAPPPEWVAGAKVTHAKFGDGVIESVITGLAGEETKLKIKFGKKNEKTLLAKFVTKAAE